MVVFENECVGCDHCANCGAKEVPHFYCDVCGDEFEPEQLVHYGFGDQMLCA